MPVLWVGPSVKKCSSHVKLYTCLMSALASQRSQQCYHERNISDSGGMCSGVVNLGLVLALVLTGERHDNRPEAESTHG